MIGSWTYYKKNLSGYILFWQKKPKKISIYFVPKNTKEYLFLFNFSFDNIYGRIEQFLYNTEGVFINRAM